ncbi:MAG: RNA 2',3'-cyclic phosphodiesterase [Actinomycetota bacterium]|nr:RNA 2',3'-cyclic phosphodiesterase [Actinomycetota bacterium]
MTSSNLRLFLAAPVPEEQLAWVEEQVEPLRALWPGARWTPRPNQHVTLKFLGSTAPELLDELTAACAEVAAAHSPAALVLSGLGAFPSSRRARVLWVGIEDPAAVLGSLAGALDSALGPLGFASETRRFTAHLTLARFKTPQRLDPLPSVAPAPGEFTLSAFDLWRSHLSPRGATYERLERFRLLRTAP